MHTSTKKRREQILALIAQHYEPGRQDRCKRWVYMHYVYKQFGISERTFYRYIGQYTRQLMCIVPKVCQLELPLF